MPQLTISIPAYNDAPTIASVVEQSLRAAAECTSDYEVLVINDGSRDETQQAIDQLCASRDRVRSARHPRNLGFGPTIREAYLEPQSEWVVFLPGDGQIPPSAVVVLWQAIAGHDLILGRRRHRQDPINRRFTSWSYNLLVSAAARRRIHDVNGTALVRRALLDRARLRSDSAFVHAEIVLAAIAAGARYREVDIEHLPRLHGEGSGNKPSVIWHTFVDLVRYSMSGAHRAARGEAGYEV